jgi:dihydroxyacetone kinase
MAGMSLTLLPVTPERITRLDAPTAAPAWPVEPGRPREQAAEPPAPVETGSAAAPLAPATEAGRALGAALSRVAEALLAAEPALTAADSVVGDGDLGISLARGARAILEALPTLPLDDPSAAARSLGVTLEHSLGGSSGPLYAAFLARASATLAKDASDWASALRDGCSAISDLGGAQPGDRTMLDALRPASEALSAALGAGLPGAEALRRAVEAARAGARATADMKPRLGRSSYLADRALGHPDPGAEAVVVWLEAILM